MPPEEVFAILARKLGFVSRYECILGRVPGAVRLRPGLPLRGRVILLGGVPMAGARVYAWDTETDAEIVGRHLGQGAPCLNGFVLTDRYGCFEIDGVPDEFILCVIAEGYGVYRARREATSQVLVTLGQGGTVEGRVFDDEGQPVTDAWVFAELEDLDYDFGCVSSERASARTRSGPDGRYRIVGLPPARYVVTADRGPRECGATEAFALPMNTHAYRCVTLERCAVLQLESEGADWRRLRWRLRTPDGRLAGNRLWNGSHNHGPPARVRGPDLLEIDCIPSGCYDLQVYADWSGPRMKRRVELRPGETLRLAFPPPR